MTSDDSATSEAHRLTSEPVSPGPRRDQLADDPEMDELDDEWDEFDEDDDDDDDDEIEEWDDEDFDDLDDEGE